MSESTRISQRAVSVKVADGVVEILEKNARRVRVLMFNATAEGTGSTVYVGNSVDHGNNVLAAANGWPLNEERVAAGEGWKLPANVLELFTQDAVHGLAAGADATVKIIEELK